MTNAASKLFIILISLIFIVFLILILNEDPIPSANQIMETDGNVQVYEIVPYQVKDPYQTSRISNKRYDDKYFDYLEHIQEQRKRTFHR